MKIWSTQSGFAITLGWLIALIGLIITIVLMAIGRLDFTVGGLFAAAFVARLL